MIPRMALIFLIILSCNSVNSTGVARDTIFNQKDAQGKKHGWWKAVNEKGQLSYEGCFEHGVPTGVFYRYYEDSTLKAKMSYSNNGTQVWTSLYYNDGDLAARGKYVNSKRDSIWKFYSFYTGTLSAEECYKDGLRYGLSKKFNEKGQKLEELEFVADKKNGNWKQFFPNGEKRLAAIYQNDQRNGSYTTWYESGKIEIEGLFRNNLMEGKWNYYDPSGKLLFTVHYIKGVAQGKEAFEDEQQEWLKKIDESQGKIPEPDETTFLKGVQ